MKSRTTVAICCVLLLAFVTLPLLASGYVLYLVNTLCVFLVLALGMHIVLGEAGQFSLAHATFFGIGIYVAGLLNNAFHLPFIVNMVAGGLVAACVGLVISGLALRMRDIYLALATFAFGEAMQWVFLNWDAVTGGPNGLRLAPAEFFGYRILSDRQAYYFVLFLAVLMLLATLSLVHSRLGSAFRAVRDSDVAALAMGIDVKSMKMAAFAFSAFYAGFAGGMYTLFSSFIHPDSLGFQTTILVLTMVVVGGLGSVAGTAVGVLAFGLMSELLRQFPSVQEIVYGVILMVCMMYAPRGIAGSFGRRSGAVAEERAAPAGVSVSVSGANHG